VQKSAKIESTEFMAQTKPEMYQADITTTATCSITLSTELLLSRSEIVDLTLVTAKSIPAKTKLALENHTKPTARRIKIGEKKS
jgi:hypothetical protein